MMVMIVIKEIDDKEDNNTNRGEDMKGRGVMMSGEEEGGGRRSRER